MTHWTSIILIVIAIALSAIYLIFPKAKGLHYASRLAYPKCRSEFEYAWLPGGSFTAVRLGKLRYMRCPKCKRWSWFNIWSTRIENDGQAPHTNSQL